MIRIGLDVDGVLADVIMAWLDYNNRIRQTISKHEVTDWDFWKVLKISPHDFYSEFDRCWTDGWAAIPPTEQDLGRATGDLAGLGRLDIVTARDASTDRYVKKWLDRHGISYDNYVSVAAGTLKADLDYDVFIDDSPHNAEAFVRNDKRVLLYTQPWNAHIAADPAPAVTAAATTATTTVATTTTTAATTADASRVPAPDPSLAGMQAQLQPQPLSQPQPQQPQHPLPSPSPPLSAAGGAIRRVSTLSEAAGIIAAG